MSAKPPNLNLAYATTYDATNVGNWSGLGYFIAQALRQQDFSVDTIGPLREKGSFARHAKRHAYRLFTGKRYLLERCPRLCRSYAAQVATKLSCGRFDAVFSPGTLPIAYLECREPIAFWTDATFAGMVNFYRHYTNLHPASYAEGMALEQSALDRCKLAIYSSDWAAQSALCHYQVDPAKVKVVPFGANIVCSRTVEDVERLVQSRPTDQCHLLFLGVEWERKGGDVALRVAQALNDSGQPTRLTIIGCHPPVRTLLPNFVRCLGFVSKASAAGRAKIDQALAESHFLLVPSRAETYGVVFVEANSFGVPALATDVGGIPTILRNDVNGRTFSLHANVAEYRDYIFRLMRNYDQYVRFAMSAFQEYQSRLNWSVAGQTVKRLLMEAIR